VKDTAGAGIRLLLPLTGFPIFEPIMGERFYLGNTSPGDVGSVVVLDADESHHLLRVMRVRAGQTIRVFGGGCEYEAAVETCDAEAARLKLIGRIQSPALPAIALSVAIPWLKGGRTESVVRKLTELGTAELIVYRTRRDVARLSSRQMLRLQRVAVEACKQCGRAEVPGLAECDDLADAVVRVDVDPHRCLVLYEGEQQLTLSAALRRIATSRERGTDVPRLEGPLLLASGPEGGFDHGELAAVDNRAVPVSLGKRILRADTAPIAAAAVAMSMAGEI
jgi:16S rRNA (uracil1498-N3)-methyltransferase